MMAVLLGAGIGLLLAGLAAIVYGIPVKEFSFGNTMILSGVVAACSGLIMLGLWVMARELQDVARRLGAGVSVAPQPGPALEAACACTAARRHPVRPRSAAGRKIRGSAEPPPWPAEAAAPEIRRPPPPAESRRRRQSRSAICCSRRARGRSASAPQRGPASRWRRICSRPTSVRRLRRRAACARSGRTAACDVRGCMAETGTRAPRRSAAAAAQPHPTADRRTSAPHRAHAPRGCAAGHGAQIRRGRRHGLLALLRRLDRGADAGRHDALCLDRRIARPSRPAALKYSAAVLVSPAVIRSYSPSSSAIP